MVIFIAYSLFLEATNWFSTRSEVQLLSSRSECLCPQCKCLNQVMGVSDDVHILANVCIFFVQYILF